MLRNGMICSIVSNVGSLCIIIILARYSRARTARLNTYINHIGKTHMERIMGKVKVVTQFPANRENNPKDPQFLKLSPNTVKRQIRRGKISRDK